MRPNKKITSLRWLESTSLVLSLLVAVGVFFWYERYGGMDLLWLIAAGLMVVLLFSLFLLFHNQLTSIITETTVQAAVSTSDAFITLYDRSPVSYITVAKDGTIVNTNPAAANLLRADIGELNGVNIFSLLAFDQNTDPTVFQAKVAAGQTLNELEFAITPLEGEEAIWVLLSVYKHRTEGERLVTLVDVSAQKKVDTAKSEFVALATHQLRTPIAAIRWNMELLERTLRDTLTEKQERYTMKIDRNIVRMINLINDFLSVSKLDMGTFAAQLEDVDMTEYYDGILEEYNEKITQKGLTIHRTDNPPHLVTRFDSRLFHIAISNLMSNAVKYVDAGGSIWFSYELKGSELRITVADNGMGIPADEVDRLFSKFFRATNAQTQQAEGTGLGLYAVKQSVEQMGGTIDVASVENQGTTFTIVLPAAVVSPS